MRMRVALLSLAVFCLWNASARAETFSFSDGDFNDSDWGIEFFNFRTGGTAPAGQEATGGHAGCYRSVFLTTNPAPNPTENSSIYAFHAYLPGVVDPSVDGAIVSFDLFWDVRPGPDTFGNGGFTGPALRQGDRFYVSAGLLEFVGTTQEWRTVNRLDLVV